MPISIITLLYLSLLGVAGIIGCVVLKNYRSKENSRELNEEETIVRAMGLRGLVGTGGTTSNFNAETKNRLLANQNRHFSEVSKQHRVSNARQQQFEFAKVTKDAISEVLSMIKKMVLDLSEELKHFEDIQPEIFYSSSKNISSNLTLARNLLIELNRRQEYIIHEIRPQSPIYSRIHETATEGLILSCDSVNSLISNQDRKPIHWTKLNMTVEEVISNLKNSRNEGKGKERQRSGTAEWN